MDSMKRVAAGLETLLGRRLDPVLGRRVGLVTNQSAVKSDLTSTLDALLAAGVTITALFAPEHGVTGQATDGARIESTTDHRTGLPVYSLYGDTRKPTADMLGGIDLMVFDIQDIGARFYTYLYTMAYAMEACGEAGKEFVVLDRPNPLGGVGMEGPVLEQKFASFAGLYPVPARYGMTIGEFARMVNSEFGAGVKLTVVPLSGWKRDMWFDQTGLAWVPTSPAMPALETAVVYPGACLTEGTNISEGRGTALPFQMGGAPWIDGYELAGKLNRAGLPGVRFRPVSFIPAASKYAGDECSGIQWHVMDRRVFLPVLTGVKVIETIRNLRPDEFEFRKPGADGRYFFDLLSGTDQLRLGLESGRTTEDIASDWAEGIEKFRSIRERYLIY